MFNTRTLGKKAEEAAKEFLIQQGLSIVEENYYCRQGEIDLIMRDNKQLVFVEVKYRRNAHHGSGADAVSFHKQQKIIYAARHYLYKHNLTETCSSRFDIASMSPANTPTSTTPFTIHWLKNAFY